MHKVLLCHPKFIEGDYTTKFMEKYNIANLVQERLEDDRIIEAKMNLGTDSQKYAAISAAVNAYVAHLRAVQVR